MSVFYVFQGETYEEERKGQYVWSPQLDKKGHKNAGYTMMTNIKAGDFILHNKNGKIMSISIAIKDCYEAGQPHELSIANTTYNWDDNGYRVDAEYHDFDNPVIATAYKEWLKEHYEKESAFTVNGTGKQQYMCKLADEHAIFLLERAIELQVNNDLLSYLNAALADIVGDKESEYDNVEMSEINNAVEDSKNHTKPEWSGKREKQEITTSPSTGKSKPKRNTQRAADALEHADYLCEYDKNDRIFLRKNGKPYTEPHHLIPMSKYLDFEFSVDVMENIVSLCSHCHNLLHYGRFEDKISILTKLYNERKAALKVCGLDITLEQLKSYYR